MLDICNNESKMNQVLWMILHLHLHLHVKVTQYCTCRCIITIKPNSIKSCLLFFICFFAIKNGWRQMLNVLQMHVLRSVVGALYETLKIYTNHQQRLENCIEIWTFWSLELCFTQKWILLCYPIVKSFTTLQTKHNKLDENTYKCNLGIDHE